MSVLDEFFKGPSDVERNQGLALITNGFTGYRKVEFRKRWGVCLPCRQLPVERNAV